ncbi:MAG TPA: organomercurial lyase [Chloroflexota bacterium]|nr:organomercurial lyase [Chloroflexota bacterium]
MLNDADVAATWLDRSTLPPLEECVLSEAFWRLLAGNPVLPTDICGATNLLPQDVENILTTLQAERCLRRDASGAVVAARGLMTAPSTHLLVTNRGSVYTQCTVDAVGIPAALGLAAGVEDHCASCGNRVDATISQARDVTTDPASAVIVMARCDSWAEDGIPTVCRETNFFCSRDHADAWQRERATLPGTILSPSEAAAIGRRIWGPFAREEQP